MPTDATMLEQDLDETISALFEDADSVLIMNPALGVFRTLMLTASTFDDELPELQVLATPDVLKSASDDFILASQISDLIDQETLELRTTTDIARSSFLVTDNQVITIVSLDDGVTGLHSTDGELVDKVQSTFMRDWEAGDAFGLRTPPLSRVQETLREEFGDEAADDFMMILESMDTVPREDDELDEVAIALVVAANNELLLYDISKWGEDTGVASKATFSRIKTRLEDRGLIETEKVPIDVGRPRLRLILVADDLDDVDSLAEQTTV